jgi:hypothetical protein
MSFLLEGADDDHLPESILGGIRIHKADMDKVEHYNVNVKRNAY